jgi:hypothetical protein
MQEQSFYIGKDKHSQDSSSKDKHSQDSSSKDKL